MTNYEYIKFILETGVYKGLEIRQGRMIISIVTRIDTVDFERVNAIEDFSASPIPNPPKLLPVGTKVRVFEEYDNKYGKLEGLYSVYEKLDSQYALLGIEDGQSYVVPARAVVPVLD